MSPRRYLMLASLIALLATLSFATAAQADVFTTGLTAPGTTQAMSASISSDKSDYAPGELVTLTGSNWQPGESVHIAVNDTIGATWSYAADVTADQSGLISASFNLPNWFVASYDVTATGSSGATATTSFTDANVTYSISRYPAAAGAAQTVNAGGSFSFTVDTTKNTNSGNDPRIQGVTVAAGTTTCGTSPSTIPAGWVSIANPSVSPSSPYTVKFGVTTTFTFGVAVPANQASGDYSAKVAYDVVNGSGGAGNGFQLCVHVNNDTTPPTIAFTQSPNGTNSWFKSGTASAHVVATDASGVASLSCKLDNSPVSLSNGGSTSTTLSGDVTTTTDGDHVVSCQAVDSSSAANTALYADNTTHLKRDTTAPTISASAVNHTSQTSYTAGAWTNQTVDVSFSCNDSLSGPASGSTLTGGSVSSETATGSVTSSGTCADNAGNTASPASATFSPIKIDTTAPVIAADTHGYTPGSWTNQDVTVGFSCSDPNGSFPSGIATDTVGGGTTVNTETSAAGQTVASSGSCVDRAGNSASANSVNVKIDKTAPTIASSAKNADTTDYTAGAWTNQDVTVSFTCQDSLSGAAVGSSLTGGTVSTEGSNGSVTSSGTCTDNAGNGASPASATFSPIKIDKTAPTISATALNADSSAYTAGAWTNQSVTVSFSCDDGGSGSSSILGGGQTFSAETANGSATSTGTCVDAAGNSASPSSLTFSPIKIDTTAPVIAADTHGYTPGSWTNQDVTVGFSCSDPNGSFPSGIATDTVGGGTTVNTETSVSGQTVASSGSCVDRAGNSASANSVNVKIDKTAPTIASSAVNHTSQTSYTAGAWTNQTVDVSFACQDALSGAASGSTLTGGSVAGDTATGSVTSSGTCTDNAGNSASPASATFSPIKVDKTKPTIAATATNADTSAYTPGDWTNQAVSVSFACTDSLSGRDTSVAFGGDQTLTAETSSGSVTSTGHCKDNAGNEADPSSATVSPIKIDTTAPVIAADTHGYTPGSWTNQDVTVGFSCSDPNGSFPSGIATDTVGGGTTVNTETSVSGQTVASSGSCVDRAGNSASANSVNVKIDKTAPQVHATALNGDGSAYNAGDWTNQTVTVGFTCDDALSGSTSILGGGDTFAADTSTGSATSSGSCVDRAGNTASPASITFSPVKVDKTKPAIAATAKNADNTDYTPGDWTHQNVSVSFACTDSLSGRDTGVSFGGDQTLTAETSSGSVTSTGHCKDNAGNEANPSSATVSPIKIDKTRPVIAADTHGYTPGSWTNNDVTVDGFTCADAGSVQSGVDHNTVGGGATINSDTPAGGTDVSNSGSCDDHAGNTALVKTVNVKVDKTPPTISASATTADSQPYSSGTWANQNVTVHFTCADGLSGVVACPADVLRSAETSGSQVSGTVYDNAGNHTDSNTITVQIDKTKPTVAVNGPVQGGVYTLGNVPAASCATTDALSGKNADAQLSTTGGPTGYVTATCRGGSDNAGNTRQSPNDDVSVTYQVVYRWDGYLQPINDTAHQTGVAESKFKLGATVPVKLQLKASDGSIVQGTAPTFAQKRLGSSCDVTTDSETSVAADATAGSAFRWDSTLRGYIYNFSTKGLSPGEYRIYSSMDDGLARTVDLCLTK